MQQLFIKIIHSIFGDKLEYKGVSSSMVTLLRNMYSKASAYVRTPNGNSHEFNCNKGVRQGCPLSPIHLFQISFVLLQEKLIFRDCINGLIIADDTASVSEDAGNMQFALNSLERYCDR